MNRAERRAIGGCAAVAVGCLVALAGCGLRVVPPADVQDGVPVFIADYGYHSSVVLPRSDGTTAEYAYGEWLG